MDRNENRLHSAPDMQLKNDEIEVKRSAFNNSSEISGNFNIGQVHVLDWDYTLPFQQTKLQYKLNVMTRNPTLRKVNSNCRVYLHTVWSPLNDLWEGAEVFTTRGNSGTLNLQKPRIKLDYTIGGKKYSARTPMSLSNEIGVPSLIMNSKNSKLPSFLTIDDAPETYKRLDNGNTFDCTAIQDIDALPFVVYQKAFNKLYMNRNTIFNNKHYLPDNENHRILPFNCDRVDVLNYEQPLLPADQFYSDYLVKLSQGNYDAEILKSVPLIKEELVSLDSDLDQTGYDQPYLLWASRYRQKKGDYFTSGSPFKDLLRGDTPVLNFTDFTIDINFDDVFTSSNFPGQLSAVPAISTNVETGKIGISTNSNVNANSVRTQLLNAFNKVKSSGTLNERINLNYLRMLEASTLMLERNAKTDGSYNQIIKAQFGKSSNHHNHEVEYIGGSFQDIIFSDVIQTSQNTADSQLGDKTSLGYSDRLSDVIQFYKEDYGIYMTLVTIIPEESYYQGINRKLTELKQEDIYFPLMNALPAQATLNKELFISGDDTVDNDVFNFTERFQHYKSKQSRLTGLKSTGSASLFDSASSFKYKFSKTPQFNNQFLYLSPNNVDDSVFSNNFEPPFEFYCLCAREDISPMPYSNDSEGLQTKGVNL